MVAEILTSIVGDLVKKGGAYGIKKLFSESPARKAIDSTSQRMPDLVVDHALGVWCQSNEFAELLESMNSGHIDPLDDLLTQSFIEIGGFFNGSVTATEASAKHVLEVFTGELRSELHKAEGGLAVHAREQRNQHEETRREIRQTRRELSSKISSLLQAVSGRPSPSTSDISSMESGSRTPLPSMNPSNPPPFYELDAMSFQELCRDIFAAEGGISTCEIYGVSGQSQRGVDLKAQIQEGYGSEVGQCKCYKDFPPAKIREASEEFLNHLDFWREKNVRRFILFVASPLDRRQQQDEIDEQVKRFAALGIKYEVWSSRTLRTKLKDHHDIVWRYTRSREWVENICGPVIDSSPSGSVSMDRASGLIEAVVGSRLPLYSAGLSREVARRLDEIIDTYRRGKRKDAYGQLEAVEKDSTWEILENPLKARVLRQKAAYRLEMFEDVESARSLADQAAAIDPGSDETSLRTFIRYYDEGAEAALAAAGVPSNTNLLNARTALLIQLERAQDALDQISRPPRGITPDTETKRLHALAMLLNGDVDGARSEIKRAVGDAPGWEIVRFTAAVIDYFSCLSPSSVPKRQVTWPEPPSWPVVKRDDTSLERLRSAEKEFAALAVETQRGDEWCRILESWRLACIANDVSRQEEALVFSRELLEREPTHYRVLVWSQMRNLDVDFEASEKALESNVAASTSTNVVTRIEAVSALLSLYLRTGKNGQAKELLERHERLFAEAGAQHNWNFWRVQVLLAEGLSDRAVEEAKKERDPELRRSLLLSALRVQAENSGEWKPYIRYLKRCYRRTGRAEYLFELCSIHAELGDLAYVVEHAETLVEVTQTATSVRLAAGALWKEKRLDRCLKLLNRSERYFPGRVLPGDMWRLRVNCQIAKGAFPVAVSDAKELLRRDQSTENVLMLMQAQLRQADLIDLAVTARALIHRDDVDPQSLIRAASWVHFVDIELAKSLWRRASEVPLQDPNHLKELMNAGFALGLDKELGPLFKRVQEFTGRGDSPFKLIAMDEFVTLQQERARHLDELQRSYDRGALPLHILTDSFNRTLVEILHGMPEQQRVEFNPLRQLRIFTRHGGHPLSEGLVKSSATWHLHLDVSSLITAEDLGILERVERVFKPLLISPEMTAALVLQQRKLHHHQPTQIKVSEGVLSLLQEEKLRIISQGDGDVPIESSDLDSLTESMGEGWLSALRKAVGEGGFLVDHMPLTSNDLRRAPITLPSPFDSRVVGCRAIIESMKASGWISEQNYEEAKDSLGSSWETDSPAPMLPCGANLFLTGNIAGVLEEAGLLAVVARHYEVFIDSVYVEHARSMVRGGEHLDQLKGWLGRLIDRVREGLMTGVYQCVEIADEHLAEHAREEFPDAATIRDLLAAKLPQGSVLWVDDRHINSYSRSESAPIIGVDEVLAALRHRGELTEKEYYARL